MGREHDVEKLFSEQLDRLLAGEDLKADAEIGDDMRAALDFARKMITVTPKPSPSFEGQLKTRLLHKLDETREETRREERGWLWRLVPRQPVWRAVAVSLLVIVIGIGIWASSALLPSEPVITSNLYLQVEASTNKASYAPGEPVRVEVALKNITGEPLTVEQFPPILSLMQSESRQPVFTFAAGENSRTLAAGEVAEFAVAWDQRDDSGRYAAAGSYYLELEDMYYAGQAVKFDFMVPVSFSIVTSGDGITGQIEETFRPGQSQTVNGITVVLESLELSRQGARITAMVTSRPDFNRSRPADDYAAFATYYLDRGWMRNAGMSSVEYASGGMAHVWYITEPVPLEASELLFVIANIGEWEGPWQFRVSLGR